MSDGATEMSDGATGMKTGTGMTRRGSGNSSRSRRRYRIGPRAVGSFVPDVTRKAFERFGFPAAALLTDWDAIAGPALSLYTRPERLKWPRQVVRADTDSGSATRSRNGATLVLRVDGPRAIEIQHRAGQIIDRINAYFGYQAVTELRILQAPLTTRAGERPRAQMRKTRGGNKAPAPDVSFIRNPDLREALERLGRGVQGRRPA